MGNKLGIPYMGGKRKIADKIIDFIISENDNIKYFYDLFGGGGAISFEALQRPEISKVFYNELNTGVVNLLRKIMSDGVTDDFYKWIDRNTFNKLKTGTNWKAGLVKTCWSFGNNQKDYLFSKEIEEDKKLLHEIIINDDIECLKTFNKKYDTNIKLKNNQLNMFDLKESISEKRLRIMSYLKNDDRLQRLQQLQQLERLQQLQQLELSNKSYSDVIINTPINETIIYLDPPYENTAKYENNIDHNELLEYVKKSPYKIYISSYEFYDYEAVLSIKHNSTLSATVNNKIMENLYCNKKSTR